MFDFYLFSNSFCCVRMVVSYYICMDVLGFKVRNYLLGICFWNI